jgi:ABC-type cobalamin/Fe3+-siderophores transport system ATPase subunit
MALQLCDEIWMLTDNSIQVNTPDALINNNQLDNLFGNENVTFNREKKIFEIK